MASATVARAPRNNFTVQVSNFPSAVRADDATVRFFRGAFPALLPGAGGVELRPAPEGLTAALTFGELATANAAIAQLRSLCRLELPGAAGATAVVELYESLRANFVATGGGATTLPPANSVAVAGTTSGSASASVAYVAPRGAPSRLARHLPFAAVPPVPVAQPTTAAGVATPKPAPPPVSYHHHQHLAPGPFGQYPGTVVAPPHQRCASPAPWDTRQSSWAWESANPSGSAHSFVASGSTLASFQMASPAISRHSSTVAGDYHHHLTPSASQSFAICGGDATSGCFAPPGGTVVGVVPLPPHAVYFAPPHVSAEARRAATTAGMTEEERAWLPSL